MNDMSYGEIFRLICCPPCPSRIASKLAFLPPDPTYEFISDCSGKCRLHLNLNNCEEWQYSEHEKENMEGFYVDSRRGNKIACLFVRCSSSSRFTILFSHGNAVDLGQMGRFYLGLGSQINCNILSYDYSGYGLSLGKPTERNMCADIDAAWQALGTRYDISPHNVILYGQSIGTVPTIDLASRFKVAAVVLHSPLMSGVRVAFPSTKRTWCFDSFTNIDKVSKIRSPTLVIHGTDDQIIDFSHGLSIFDNCSWVVDPLWVEGAGHNDIEMHHVYLERLKQFVNVEIGNILDKIFETSLHQKEQSQIKYLGSMRTMYHHVPFNICIRFALWPICENFRKIIHWFVIYAKIVPFNSK